MSSPLTLDGPAGGGVEELPPDALPSPLPLPPPPPPPAQPSITIPPQAAPSLASSSPYFPFNEPTVLLFLDPFSPEAQDLKKTLEITSQAYGQTFPSTTDARLASHLVLDPSCDDNQFLRRLAPEKVVSIRWLKEGFLKAAPPPEDQFRLDGVEDKQEKVEGRGDRAGGRVENVKQKQKGSLKDTDFVSGSASPNGWLRAEEEELARYLASDPPDDRSIWEQYHRSHPSRSTNAYREHYRLRKEEYFDLKVAELKKANNGRPIEYEHPEVEEVEVEEVRREFASFTDTRRAQPISYREKDSRSPPPPRRVDPDVGLTSGFCSNCKVDQARQWYGLKGKGDRRFCGGCRATHYKAERDAPGTGDDALAEKRRKVLPNEDLRSSSEDEESDLSDLDDPRPSQSSSQLASSSSSRPAVLPDFVKCGVGSGFGCHAPWSKEEDNDLVRLLAHRKGSRDQVWIAFCAKHPRRTTEASKKRYQARRDVMDREIVAIQRKEGKQSTSRAPAPMSESEELEEDDSMGDDEDSDDDENRIQQTFRSTSAMSNFLVNKKRPTEPQQGSSSKRTKVDSPFDAVASSSKSSSSSSHHHQLQSHHRSSSYSYTSGSNHPLNQPRPSQPSFTRPVASSSSSSSQQPYAPTSFQHASFAHSARSAPLPPFPPQADSSSDEDLQPPSFLELGTRPTGCPPSSPWCFFCGCDKDGSDTFKELSLAAENTSTGEIHKIQARLACDVCESTWEKRFVRKLKLGMDVAEMGELERLAWVTEVLIEKGREVKRERVYGSKA